jgi:hypothetical protein
MSVYHLELRQFPHSARAFNLERAEVGSLLAVWVSGAPVRWGEREWEPRKAALRILEGPPLAASSLGMGRGWQEAQRSATEVTDALLAEARAPAPGHDELRRAVLERCAAGPASLAALLAAGEGQPAGAVERAVWSLLGEGELELLRRRAR